MLCARFARHQTKIGELHRRTVVRNRKVFGFEIKHGFVLLIVNHEIESDFIHSGNDRGALRLCRRCRFTGRGLSVTWQREKDEKNGGKQRNYS